MPHLTTRSKRQKVPWYRDQRKLCQQQYLNCPLVSQSRPRSNETLRFKSTLVLESKRVTVKREDLMTDFSQERGNMEVDDLEIHFHKTVSWHLQKIFVFLENLHLSLFSNFTSLITSYDIASSPFPTPHFSLTPSLVLCILKAI